MRQSLVPALPVVGALGALGACASPSGPPADRTFYRVSDAPPPVLDAVTAPGTARASGVGGPLHVPSPAGSRPVREMAEAEKRA